VQLVPLSTGTTQRTMRRLTGLFKIEPPCRGRDCLRRSGSDATDTISLKARRSGCSEAGPAFSPSNAKSEPIGEPVYVEFKGETDAADTKPLKPVE